MNILAKRAMPIVALLLIFFFMAGCSKDDDDIKTFNLDLRMPFPVSAITVVDSIIELRTFEFETSIEDVLIANNSSKDKLKKAVLDFLDLEILFPASAHFDFLKDIELYMDAPGLEPDIFGFLYDIPKDQRKMISLEVLDKSAHRYLRQDKIQLILKLKLREPMTEDLIIRANSRFIAGT